MLRKEILKHIDERQEVLFELIGGVSNYFCEIMGIIEEIKYLEFLYEKFDDKK